LFKVASSEFSWPKFADLLSLYREVLTILQGAGGPRVLQKWMGLCEMMIFSVMISGLFKPKLGWEEA
jgi:hypothetical protein